MAVQNGVNNLLTNGIVQTGTTAGNAAYLKAYDVDGAIQVVFATLTANNTPTMDLSDSVTKAGQYIYRAAGTDVAVADGGTGVSTAPTDGQLLIGSTGVGYVVASLTAGTNVTITPGAGSISIASADNAMVWTSKNAAFNMAVNNGYLADGAAASITGTLPAAAALGTRMRVLASGAFGFSIAQNAGQSIIFGNQTTTVGVGGSLSTTTHQGDAVELVCIVADTTFMVASSTGNLLVV